MKGERGNLILNKKAKLNWYDHWAEYLAFIALVVAFIIGITILNVFLSYVTSFLMGLMVGRVWFRYKRHLKFTWFLVIMGFMLGYVIGTFYSDTRIIIALFVLGWVIGYVLHDRAIIKSRDV